MTAEPATVPVVVIEGPPGCTAPEVERLRAAGKRIIDGFRAPAHPRRGSVCVGVVDNEATAVEALLAVLAGAGLVVEARGDRAVIDRFVDDLRRRGPVDHRAAGGTGAGAAPEPDLSVEARAILGMLAMGLSLGEAAHVLGLARRTADRRLAEARRALGVTRTTEAIAKARRLGWLDPAKRPPGRSGGPPRLIRPGSRRCARRLQGPREARTIRAMTVGSPLIGREAELAALATALDGDRATVLVGEAGIGKTALVRAVATRLDRTMREGGAFATLRGTPYFALRRAVDAALRGDPATVAARLEHRIGPDLLFVDDAQWADEGPSTPWACSSAGSPS